MNNYYFDYAAATPMSGAVVAAMQTYLVDKFYNPSALYVAAQDARKALQSARELVAHELGCKSSEVIFTAGGTESDNLAVDGVMRQFPDANIVVSAIEHDAVLKPAQRHNYKIAPISASGRVDVKTIDTLIDENTVLVSIMYANNEIGTIQPLRDIAKVIKLKKENRKLQGNTLPLYFHTDACQAANYLPLLVNNLGVDLMTLNGGKIYGPKQSGVLFVRSGITLQPQILGGGQERNIRSGTENVAGNIGFATALQETAKMKEEESKRLKELQDYCIKQLRATLPNAIINGSMSHRLPNNIHLTIPGRDNERLLMELDERGVMVATGSACSASSDEPSHVLTALGMSDDDARCSIRITFGRQTQRKAVDKLVENIVFVVNHTV